MARRHQSRRARNQAKWDAHASTIKTTRPTTKIKTGDTSGPIMPGLGSYAGGEAPVFTTGGVSPVPHTPTVTQRKGINLKPFADHIPGTPGTWTSDNDWDSSATGAGSALVKTDHVRHDKMVWARVNLESNRRCTASEEKCAKNHGSKCGPGRVWENVTPHRELLDIERAKLDVREAHESAMMATDRPSGAEKFKTHAERHEGDAKAGLYRDGLGRIMRTVDMDGWNGENGDRFTLGRTMLGGGVGWDSPSLTCDLADDGRVIILEVNTVTGETRPRGQSVIGRVDSTMSTTDYAQLHSVPIRRNAMQRAQEAAKAKALRAEARDAKRAAKEQDRIQRKLDRATGQGGASHVSRAEMDEAARAVLAARGVTEPTKTMMAAARDMIAHQKQINEYVGGNA